MKKTLTITIAVLAVCLVTATARAQVITPTGVTETAATQLIAWFTDNDTSGMADAVDDFATDSNLFVINTSNTSGVTVHIQIWAAELGTGDPVTDPCTEVNFTDTLTPNDTHNYDFDDLVPNTDPCIAMNNCGGADEVAQIPAALEEAFITVTAVVGPTDRRAIAFNHLVGYVEYDNDNRAASVNAMGREARSFVDSSLLPDGTVLDGITGGLVLIQAEVLKTNFSQLGLEFDDTVVDPGVGVDDGSVISIVFQDNYSGPFGDYRSEPGTATFSPLIFDEAEVPTSCQTYSVTCVRHSGINEELDDINDDIDLRICDGNTLDTGWLRLAVSGLSGLTNVHGVVAFQENSSSGPDGLFAYARWMVAEGDSEFPAPATPTPTAEPSATPTPDGSPTPTGGGEPGGGGGGGSGCAIAGPVQAGTAAANALIVLLPGAAFALRRRFAK